MKLFDAEMLAIHLMRDHGLHSVKFRFDNAKMRRGAWSAREQTIRLSEHFVRLNDEERVRLTILHEIAHALKSRRYPLDRQSHGWRWKQIAREIGAVPERCASSLETNMPEGKWTGVCTLCDLAHPRHKSPRSGTYIHKGCGGTVQFYLTSELRAKQRMAAEVSDDETKSE